MNTNVLEEWIWRAWDCTRDKHTPTKMHLQTHGLFWFCKPSQSYLNLKCTILQSSANFAPRYFWESSTDCEGSFRAWSSRKCRQFFHANSRLPNCSLLENWNREALFKDFRQPLLNGNVDSTWEKEYYNLPAGWCPKDSVCLKSATSFCWHSPSPFKKIYL